MPVVILAAAGVPIIGRVITEPEWARMPSSSQTTWATMLAGEYYRKAVVEFMSVTSAHAALSSGDSTAITVGCPLKWDVSSDGYADNGTTMSGAFSFHYTANTAQATILVGFGVYAADGSDTDCAGVTVQA
jgi:hypothetical protein